MKSDQFLATAPKNRESSNDLSKDCLQRYLFEKESIRGELVQLHETYQSILKANPNYPYIIQELLGELLVATCLLTATLKFSGTITIQLQGDGPISLAVINGSDLQEMRGIVHWDEDSDLLKLKKLEKVSLSQLFGKSHMVITLTPTDGARYQGLVGLEGDSLAECLREYFLQSEQLNTTLWLRADPKLRRCGGLLLQQLPLHLDKPSMQNKQKSDSVDSNKNEDQYESEYEKAIADFNHLATLTATIKNEELFLLDPQELLYRLYHEHSVQLYPSQAVRFVCSCSREKSESALVNLTKKEVMDMLSAEQDLTMHCDYCGSDYKFSSMEIEEIQKSKLIH